MSRLPPDLFVWGARWYWWSALFVVSLVGLASCVAGAS